jgi:methylglyoxal synthase
MLARRHDRTVLPKPLTHWSWTMSNTPKTLIGVLASHDAREKNVELCNVLEHISARQRDLLDYYHFVMTGGTYNRLILGDYPTSGDDEVVKVSDKTKRLLADHITVLPSFGAGGLILLSYLVTQRRMSLLWLFLSPLTNHWLHPEDMALMRLGDVWRAKRLMNEGSTMEWLEHEAELDRRRNEQEIPLALEFLRLDLKLQAKRDRASRTWSIDPRLFQREIRDAREKRTIALISHDELKPRMIEFAVDHENDLLKFDRILTTGTTGKLIGEATTRLDRIIHRYHSGPKGGDVEIAAEILFDLCDAVVFFVDPLHPHPHVDDIRVVFGACMRKPEVRMLANEVQAREWMDRVVRRW